MKRTRSEEAVAAEAPLQDDRATLLARVNNRLVADAETVRGRLTTAAAFDTLVEANALGQHLRDPQNVFAVAGVEPVRLETEALDQWKERAAARGPHVRAFAEAFASAVQFISWDKFTRALRAAAEDVVARLQRERMAMPNSITVLLVDMDALHKSNMWLSAFVWPILKPHVDFVASACIDLARLYMYMGVRQRDSFDAPRVNVLYVDDMTYSGSQLATNAFSVRTASVKRDKQGDADKALLQGLAEGIFVNPKDRAHYHLIVPFATHLAMNYIRKSASFVSFPATLRMIEAVGPFVSYAGKKLLEYDDKHPGAAILNVSARVLIKFAIDCTLPLVFFEHKVADLVSIEHEFAFGHPALFGLPSLVNKNAYAMISFYKRLPWFTSDGRQQLKTGGDFRAHFAAHFAAHARYTCLQCGVRGLEHSVCGHCFDAVYCSRACQQRAWVAHAPLCARTEEKDILYE